MTECIFATSRSSFFLKGLKSTVRKAFSTFIVFSSLILNASQAENITEQLLQVMINQQLPEVLYQQSDQAWQLGLYQIQISKTADAALSSSGKAILLSLPIQIQLNADMNKVVLGNNMDFSCNSAFSSNAKISIRPQLNVRPITTDVDISIAIPPTMLDCNGLLIPIQKPLEQVIAQNTPKWQKDVAAQANFFLAKSPPKTQQAHSKK